MRQFFAGAIRQIQILYQNLEFFFAVAPVANTAAGDPRTPNQSFKFTVFATSNVNQVIHRGFPKEGATAAVAVRQL